MKNIVNEINTAFKQSQKHQDITQRLKMSDYNKFWWCVDYENGVSFSHKLDSWVYYHLGDPYDPEAHIKISFQEARERLFTTKQRKEWWRKNRGRFSASLENSLEGSIISFDIRVRNKSP